MKFCSTGETLVTLTVTDNHGASSQCTATVTVVNADPEVTLTGPVNGSIYPVITPARVRHFPNKL